MASFLYKLTDGAHRGGRKLKLVILHTSDSVISTSESVTVVTRHCDQCARGLWECLLRFHILQGERQPATGFWGFKSRIYKTIINLK